ncbi:hypothetical protein LINPERPRIM_LOCUS39801 [Linum perenne]
MTISPPGLRQLRFPSALISARSPPAPISARSPPASISASFSPPPAPTIASFSSPPVSHLRQLLISARSPPVRFLFSGEEALLFLFLGSISFSDRRDLASQESSQPQRIQEPLLILQDLLDPDELTLQIRNSSPPSSMSDDFEFADHSPPSFERMGKQSKSPNQGNLQIRESAPSSANSDVSRSHYPVRGLVPFVTRPECRCGKSAGTSFVGFMNR